VTDWQPGDPVHEWGYDVTVRRAMFQIMDDIPNLYAAARWTPERGWGPAWEA